MLNERLKRVAKLIHHGLDHSCIAEALHIRPDTGHGSTTFLRSVPMD
jgi:hypothetical protein